MKRAAAVALLLMLAGAPSAALTSEQPLPFEVTVEATEIGRFRIASDDRRFGQLEFVGGMELRSKSSQFGAISGFRRTGSDGRFVAVTDTGYWIFGRIARDDSGSPSGFADVSMQVMANASGDAFRHKGEADAESLHVDGDIAIVGFERDHRIATYQIRHGAASAEISRIDLLVPRHEIRGNGGFEALARAPAKSHLRGALIAITEQSIDRQGNLFAAILEGPRRGIFKVAKKDAFAVTDATFLPDGDLLLLERSFSFIEGVRMRFRRIALNDIQPGNTVDGAVLFQADMRYQIDNMEAVDAWRDRDGAVRIAVLSDDNNAFFQRTIYLEFTLAPSAGRTSENSTP